MKLLTLQIYHDIVQDTVMHHTARSRYALIPLWHISQQEPFYFRSIAWQGTASMLKLFPGFFVFLQKCFLVFCFLWFVQENQFPFKFCGKSQMREYFPLWLLNNKFLWYNLQRAVSYLWTLKFFRYFLCFSPLWAFLFLCCMNVIRLPRPGRILEL